MASIGGGSLAGTAAATTEDGCGGSPWRQDNFM